MTKIEQAKATLREAGFYTGNLWHIDDVKDRYEGCDDVTAMHILDEALNNEATMEQIWFAIDFAIDEDKEENEDDEAQKVFEILKKEYARSEVVSGEFIHSTILTLGFSEEIVRKGIQKFLDWDESEETFEIEQGRLHWIIKPTNN